MRVLGIDPGLSGGLVILEDNKIVEKMVAPIIKNSGKGKTEYEINLIIDFIKRNKVEFAGLEQAQAMPGQGVRSMFSIGKGFGMYWGIISSLDISYILPRPIVWQKEVLLGYDRSDTKQASALFCSRTWPKEEWRASSRCRKAHDGLTDAGCIAWYTLKHFK